ncbi:MAG: adenylate/guanylate cyclase domain-containing protein [Actinobacteria bacterium]|nr:MAG: adenylate/guanylate cyclase domain-containing protein [Actinomycetota bacterium]
MMQDIGHTLRLIFGMRFKRTFIFVDLSGFTNYTESFGDGAAAQLLTAFRGIARAVGSHQGVRIDKYLGDGLMAVAVEALDGITFALELQRHAITACSPLSLRIGVATGDTMLFEGQDYIGNAPNLAARLCDAAVGIGTLIPAEQAERLPVGVYSVPHDPVKLPGFSQPINVVSLAGEPLIDGRYDINDFWTRSPFVG